MTPVKPMKVWPFVVIKQLFFRETSKIFLCVGLQIRVDPFFFQAKLIWICLLSIHHFKRYPDRS